MDLTVVEAAIAREEWRVALDAALAWWRRTRAPELAGLVDILAERLATPRLPLHGAVSFHARWLAAIATDPLGNLDPALAALGRALHHETESHEACWRARMAALDSLDDPRIAVAFVEQLRAYPLDEYWDNRGAAYEPLFAGLERLGDIRQVDALRALVVRPIASRGWVRKILARELPRVADAITASTPAPLPEREEVRALVERISPRAAASDDAELLALVHRTPDDDGPREVLADRWIERGDPRGELVTLQLKAARGTATDKDRKKIETLVRKHEKTWLGSLAQVTKQHREWHRGFLDVLELHAPTRASAAIWLETSRAPALATVRVLRKGHGSENHFRRFVQAAPNLREVIAVSKDTLAELLASPPPRLERLGVEHVLDDASYDAIAVAFPKLKTLWIPDVDIDVQIQRVAAFLRRRALDFEIVLRCDGGSLVSVAPWLLAVRAELAPLRDVTLLIGGPFVRASAGARGLRLHLSIPHLHWVRHLLPTLAPIEHVTLTLPPGSPRPSEIRRLYDRLLAPVADVAVDEAWRAALAQEP